MGLEINFRKAWSASGRWRRRNKKAGREARAEKGSDQV